MFYGAVVWDPWLIVAQIVCLQCLYYLTLGVFLSILVGTRVSKMSLVYFFDYATVTASTVTGWCVIASIFLSSVAGSILDNILHLLFQQSWLFSLFSGKGKEMPGLLCNPLYHPPFHLHHLWRLALINNVVGCEHYKPSSDGIAR
ncbi:UNVERIFIED_CONTAM: hypothetical protein Scaly_2946400 [Sesamum calycinum]|uniref:Uncharacterized protein n=1 Tax=Sesamum calycinum TaxID=2727403 RepID=A0AAW2KTH7_9LAMI